MSSRSPSTTYRVVPLSNGIRLAMAHMPHMTSVSLGVWAAVGGRHESAALNGVSHFIEHMLFKGTKRRNARQISQAVEGIGGHLNAFTSEEHTCFYAKACHDRFDQLLDVLSDMVLHSRFDPEELEKERAVIKEEVAMYRDQPQQYVHELLNALQWPDHPLGRPLTGTEETVDRLSRRILLDYFSDCYVASNLLVSVAGNFDPRRTAKAIERRLGRVRAGPPTRFTPVVGRQSRPATRVCSKPVEQTQMALGVRTCSRHDERRYALRLLNAILGENMSSRLFQSIREDRGLAYSVYSSLSFFHDTGDFVISAGLEAGKLTQVLELTVAELRRMTRTSPSTGELRRARDYLIGQIDLSRENTESQMMWLGEQVLGHDQIAAPERIKDRLGAVRPSDLRAVATDFFRPDRLNLALITPLKRPRRLQRILAAVAD